MKDAHLVWIEEGYRVFAKEGPQGLKVEPLAREIGKSKSSFYHHFADLEVFTEFLLQWHLQQAQVMAEKEAQSRDLEDVIGIILDHKMDLLFNRQLRVHRENQKFEACFCKTNELTFPAFMAVWARLLNLQHQSYLAGMVLKLSIENFFLQITEETLNPDWLRRYFYELISTVQLLRRQEEMQSLDGGV